MATSLLRILSRAANLRANRQLERGWLGRQSPVLTLVVAILALVALGTVLIPFEITGRTDDNPGGDVLEMAFWLTCLAAAVSSFRIMEALFRTGDARILAPYPIPPHTLFIYRTTTLLREALLIACAGTLVFVPVIWRADPALFAACAWVWTSGLLVTLALGLGIQLYAGVSQIRGDNDMGAFGPAAFSLSPGIALGVSVFVILLEKLVAEEFLKAGFNGGARFGLTVSGGLALISVVAAYRWFNASFYVILARFYQADLFVLDTGYNYFGEGPPPEPTGLERRLPRHLVPLVRKETLQFRRRHTLARLLVWGVAIGLFAMLVSRGANALPPPLLGPLPMLVVVAFANPWGRLFGPDLERGMGATLPVTTQDLWHAKRWVAAREALLLTTPLIIAMLLGLWQGDAPALDIAQVPLAAAALAIGAHPWLFDAARRHQVTGALSAGVVIAVLASITGALHSGALIGFAILLLLTGQRRNAFTARSSTEAAS